MVRTTDYAMAEARRPPTRRPGCRFVWEPQAVETAVARELLQYGDRSGAEASSALLHYRVRATCEPMRSALAMMVRVCDFVGRLLNTLPSTT
jgi:hypothetical protein